VLKTRFTDLVGCTVPIQQAGMGYLASARLAKGVADAGGLGIVSVYSPPQELVAGILDDLAEHTPGVIGGNIMPIVVDPDRLLELVAITAQRVRVVDFFYSNPDPALVKVVHAHGALACWQVGSREEAVAAAEAGCDLIVAQGIEAGGHVRGHIGLLALLSEVLDAVDVPVLAAGGIGTGRAMAAALAAGADGVRVGTRFVASEEAEAHPEYVQALIDARAADTVYTNTFALTDALNDAERPHRALRSAVDAAQSLEDDVIGEDFRPETGKRSPVRRFQKMTATLHTTGTVQAMSLWAGESVGGVTRLQPAGDIVREMAEEAEMLLRRWAP
jgi:nitronate monooxygenase